jgi:hypothetical protein
LQQQVFATPEKLNLQLKVDTAKLKFTDVNGNKKLDPGEFAGILGNYILQETK